MSELKKRHFGITAAGEAVEEWTLCAGEYEARVLTYGGALRTFLVPAPGGARDIVLGCDSLAEYEAQTAFLGATVGRVANRIGGAAFTLNNKRYTLAANDGPNCLHGGLRGFDRAVWRAREEDGALTLAHTSPDGEEGFPGTLEAHVRYSLCEDGALTIDYWARSDADTLCSLTNHSYFNLLGHDAGSLAGHWVQIFADHITPNDATCTPTGALMPVEGTPFDLREPRELLSGLAGNHPQLDVGNGYDHNFALHSEPAGPLRPAARIAAAGVTLECSTTQPGLQFYTANAMQPLAGKQGALYGPRCAFCLEAQGWPNAARHPRFPSPILRAGAEYRQRTVYRAVPSPR